MQNELKVFENKNIRSPYDEKNEKWFFSIIDIMSILTESKNPRRYWSDLMTKLIEEEGFSQLYERIVQLKLTASGGKNRETDCADVETLLRIIQSVPSKKAEPVKQWLAKVGYERMKEMTDPSTAIDRARETYKKLGCSEKWIQQRMMGQETRNKLTDYWKDHEITESENATGMEENKKSAKRGGKIARDAKEKLELEIGQKVVTSNNFLPKQQKTKQIKNKDNEWLDWAYSYLNDINPANNEYFRNYDNYKND